MKAIQLKEFISNNNIEYHYYGEGEDREVYFFVPFYCIKDFAKLLDSYDFDDGGVECCLKDGYIGLKASIILEPRGIDFEEVFENLNGSR